MKATKLLLLLSLIIAMSCTSDIIDESKVQSRSGETEQNDTLTIDTGIGDWTQGAGFDTTAKEKG